MMLSELIKPLVPQACLSPAQDFPVKGITCDSRKAGKDFIFVAVKGVKDDGNKFIRDALKNGARAVVTGSRGIRGIRTEAGIPVIEAGDDRKAVSRLACDFYGDPSARIRVSGVTGTNGKTTITYLMESVLERCGLPAGVIGTVNCRFGGKSVASGNTTPGPLDLQEILERMRREGASDAVMEVSSHALDQGRTELVRFSAAIFTNLTQDHLDYHKNMEDYFLAKSRLFTGLTAGAVSVINTDDPYGRKLAGLCGGRLVTYGIDLDSDVRAADLRMSLGSSEFLVLSAGSRIKLKTRLIGKHNVYNVLAAFAWAQALGLDREKVSAALEDFSQVPGRMEPVDAGQSFRVFVDYAHTEDALKNVLTALRQLSPGKIIVVFGCGGERDKTKRPKMGKLVCRMADYAVITDDNPRSEDPEGIIKDIRSGIDRDNFCVIPDRLEAIRRSLSLAGPGDVVLIAGKGHENYQVLKDKTLHFDDREAAGRCLRSMS